MIMKCNIHLARNNQTSSIIAHPNFDIYDWLKVVALTTVQQTWSKFVYK
jgi:hypothetical protein